MSAETPVVEIRRQAHRLAAEAISAALNMWDLDRYYPDERDQGTLAIELTAIANRLRKRGGEQR